MTLFRLSLRRLAATALAAGLSLPAAAQTAPRPIVLQSTTSTANSGLYDHILPIFRDATGIEVRVVAVGTGQAIRNAANCDGDVLLVHAREAEDAFVASGGGTGRTDVMFNDFVIVGPTDDPAGAGAARDAAAALAAIATSGAPFASRGDGSGTHLREMALWQDGGVDPAPGSGDWYRELGAGMGATLNAAAAMDAYALTDRATWTTFGNRGALTVLVEGDPDLRNQYGVIPVNPDACPDVASDEVRTFVDWLTGPDGQAAIGAFEVSGEQLFVPNAPKGDD